MNRFIPLCTILFVLFYGNVFSANCTWTGNISSDWDNASNWTCGLIPGAADNVTFNNAAAPFMPELNGDRTVTNFTINAGSINLQSFTLTTTNSNIQNCVINSANGAISGNRISQISNTTFNGDISLTKTGGANDTWTGNNVFNGNTVITNSGTANIIMANTNGDNFNADVTLNNFTATNNLTIARSGNTVFGGNLTLNQTSTGTTSFGANGGTSTINSGGALLSAGFTSGTLNLSNFIQNGNAPNGTLNPTALTINSSNFGGAFTATNGNNYNVQNSTFHHNVTLSSNRISQLSNSSFGSNSTNQIQITKEGGTNDDWNGNNIFNGELVLTNNGSARIRLSNGFGNSFNSDVTINNFTTTSSIEIARTGSSTFEGNITINQTSTGTTSLGSLDGISLLTNGSIISTQNSGTINLTNVTQNNNTPLSLTSQTNLTVNNSHFNGSLSAVGTSNFNIQNSSFTGNVNLTAGRISQLANTSFGSNIANNIQITKTGGTNDAWTGNNTFYGTTTITNAGSANITVANTTGDTYYGNITFNNYTTSNNLVVARSGNNNFHSNITAQNTSSGTLTFGANAGVVNIIGNTTQHISGTGLITIPRLTVDKSLGGLILNTNVSISNTLNLTEGILYLNGNILRMTAANVVVNRTNGMIVSEENNPGSGIQWNVANTAGTYIFHFGNPDGIYIPVTYQQNSGNAGNVTISTYATFSNNTPFPTGVTHVNDIFENDNSDNVVDRFWYISRSGTGGNVSLTFTYTDAEIPANGNDNLMAQQWSNGWLTPIGGQSGNSVTTGPVTNFPGPWTLSRADSPLPIELIYFNITIQNCIPVIEYTISADEPGNSFVQFSKDAKEWETIFSNEIQEPNTVYAHKGPLEEQTYCRIMIKNRDNSKTIFSDIKLINKCLTENLLSKVYPNPAKSQATVYSHGEILTLKNCWGGIVKIFNNLTPLNYNTIDISEIPSGTYFIYNGNEFSTLIIIND